VALAPASFIDPREEAAFGDYAYAQAQIELASGHRPEAKAALQKALTWKRDDPELLGYKLKNNL
jgi:hypothetical protein